jgi:hypothetical protein
MGFTESSSIARARESAHESLPNICRNRCGGPGVGSVTVYGGLTNNCFKASLVRVPIVLGSSVGGLGAVITS